MSQFDVSFDRSASFRGQQGNRPFVLLGNEGSSQLTELRLSLDAAMLRNGLRQPRNAGYTPHITLLYDAQGIEELPIEPISWTVSEFVLVHSMHGHLHLARWPLLSS
jgi:2'-5' RNA ligase